MKLGLLFVDSGQFNYDNIESVNFPDFCRDATTVVDFNVSILNSSPTVNIYF